MPKHQPADTRYQHDVDTPLIRRSIDGERLLAVFSALVEPIGRSLPPSTEVVLHDLSLLPNSIVAIHGDVTRRKAGDPATDLLLSFVLDGTTDHHVGYVTTLPDGREIRSATMLIRDVSGNAVAALCLNTDLSVWRAAQRVVDEMLNLEPPRDARPEVFAKSVDELADHLMEDAIRSTGVSVEKMHKEHKVAVVRDLKERGMFLIREGVDMVAARLQVSRFTIYNYLNEIKDEDGTR